MNVITKNNRTMILAAGTLCAAILLAGCNTTSGLGQDIKTGTASVLGGLGIGGTAKALGADDRTAAAIGAGSALAIAIIQIQAKRAATPTETATAQAEAQKKYEALNAEEKKRVQEAGGNVIVPVNSTDSRQVAVYNVNERKVVNDTVYSVQSPPASGQPSKLDEYSGIFL